MYQLASRFVIVNAMVALLRGINVGGRNRVPMADLRDMFTSLGFEHVESVIQSGNMCFSSGRDPDDLNHESELCATIGAAINSRFGVDSPVVIRTAAELAAAIDAHPFAPGDFDPKFHHIMFLASSPDQHLEALADLSPHDRHMVIGREIHVLYTSGSAHSKFTVTNVERHLGVVATARNLATCTKIRDRLWA